MLNMAVKIEKELGTWQHAVSFQPVPATTESLLCEK